MSVKSTLTILFIAIFCIVDLNAQSDNEVVENKFKQVKNSSGNNENRKIGSVNWTGQFIEASGESFLNTDLFKIPGQAQSMAEQGAKAVALANLLEITGSVKVTKTTTVQNMLTENVTIKTEVEGLVRGAQIVSQSIGANSVKVIMRLPLYGDEGLAHVFRFVDSSGEDIENVTKQTNTSNQEEIKISSERVGNTGNSAELANQENATVIQKKIVDSLTRIAKENGDAVIPLLNIKQNDFIKNALTLIPNNIVNEKGEVVIDMQNLFRKTGMNTKYLRYTDALMQQLKAAGVKTEKIDAVYKEGQLVINEQKLMKSGRAWNWMKINGARVLKYLPLLVGAL
jgi:hypothetical protein